VKKEERDCDYHKLNIYVFNNYNVNVPFQKLSNTPQFVAIITDMKNVKKIIKLVLIIHIKVQF